MLWPNEVLSEFIKIEIISPVSIRLSARLLLGDMKHLELGFESSHIANINSLDHLKMPVGS